MEQINNYNDYLKCLEEIKKLEKKPKLLIHACCAPCSSEVLEELKEYFEITVYYYNPNIYPLEEYEKRYEEFKRNFTRINSCYSTRGFEHVSCKIYT